MGLVRVPAAASFAVAPDIRSFAVAPDIRSFAVAPDIRSFAVASPLDIRSFAVAPDIRPARKEMGAAQGEIGAVAPLRTPLSRRSSRQPGQNGRPWHRTH